MLKDITEFKEKFSLALENAGIAKVLIYQIEKWVEQQQVKWFFEGKSKSYSTTEPVCEEIKYWYKFLIFIDENHEARKEENLNKEIYLKIEILKNKLTELLKQENKNDR